MTNSTRFIQAVLVLVTVLAPMTLLRFSVIGVAELLMALLFLHQAAKGVRVGLLRQFPLTIFWAVFLFLSVCGAVANSLVMDNATGTLAGLTFDLAAYIFMFITCFTLERLASHEGLDLRRLLRNVFFFASATLSVLYVVSRITPTLFGLPLLYYGKFVPLAENLHQISMFLVPFPFLGMIVLRTERGVVMKLLAAGLIGMDVLMAIETGSTKADMALPIGAGVLAWAYSLRALGPRYFVLVNSLYATAAALVAMRMQFVDMALEFFVANDNQGARAVLYGRGIVTGMESFLVGRGPGQHVEYVAGGFSDAHQTVLTVFLQSGIIGVVALVALAVRIVRRAFAEPALIAALATVAVYALGGDILRRLPIWIVIFIIAHYPVAARAPRRLQRGVFRPAPAPRPAWQGTGRRAPAWPLPTPLPAPARAEGGA